MSCFVYILGSEGKGGYRTYVGWTTDLNRRLGEHNSGIGARSTRGRRWVLLYAERYAIREEAMSADVRLFGGLSGGDENRTSELTQSINSPGFTAAGDYILPKPYKPVIHEGAIERNPKSH